MILPYSRRAVRAEWFYSRAITISSAAGVGGTTTATNLTKALASEGDWRVIGAGKIFRDIGRGMGFEDIKEFAQHARDHPELKLDEKLDEEMSRHGETNGFCADGRVVHITMPHAFHILLSCPEEVAASRRYEAEHQRDPYHVVLKGITDRNRSDRARYDVLYPGWFWQANEFDVYASTHKESEAQVLDRIIRAYKKWREWNRKRIRD